jgi:hypothetical protein
LESLNKDKKLREFYSPEEAVKLPVFYLVLLWMLSEENT